MNGLYRKLSTGMSKETARSLASEAMQNDALLAQLVEVACTGPSPQDQKSAWVLWAISETAPHMLAPFATTILQAIPTKQKSGARRDLFKAVTRVSGFNEEQKGLALDIAFRNLENAKSSIAEKHSSIAYIKSQLIDYPEFTDELKALLHLQKELGTAPFQRFVQKTIHQLERRQKIKAPN